MTTEPNKETTKEKTSSFKDKGEVKKHLCGKMSFFSKYFRLPTYIKDMNGNILYEGRGSFKRVLEEAVQLNRGLLTPRVDLKNANLKRKNLKGAFLFGSNFEGASFEGSNLKGACLEGCYLNNVNFRKANLNGVAFGFSTLTSTNIEKANLYDAHFYRSNTSGMHGEARNYGDANFYTREKDYRDATIERENYNNNNNDDEVSYSSSRSYSSDGKSQFQRAREGLAAIRDNVARIEKLTAVDSVAASN